jgi:hypothetical protein
MQQHSSKLMHVQHTEAIVSILKFCFIGNSQGCRSGPAQTSISHYYFSMLEAHSPPRAGNGKDTCTLGARSWIHAVETLCRDTSCVFCGEVVVPLSEFKP